MYNCMCVYTHIYICDMCILLCSNRKVKAIMTEKCSFDESVGTFLVQNGITSPMLLSHDSAELNPIEVTNGVALDLYRFLCKHPR